MSGVEFSRKIWVSSGELVFAEHREVLATSLGTCIAFCLFDKRLRVGGMTHFLLPDPKFSSSEANVSQNPLNFGSNSIVSLLRKFKRFGSNLEDLEASIVGGCIQNRDVETIDERSIPNFVNVARNVAHANFECAKKMVDRFGLRMKAEYANVHSRGVQMEFNTFSGDIIVRRLNPEVKKTTLNPAVRVLIIDDSISIRKLLEKALSRFADIEVVGMAENADSAEKMRLELNPDVMTLDILMPGKNGVEYLAELRKKTNIPVIMVSDLSKNEASPVIRALELGAFDYVQKPSFSELDSISEHLKNLILAAYKSKIKNSSFIGEESAVSVSNLNSKLIAIGASTGGTTALRDIFMKLPSVTPPIIVVQHLPPAFTRAFADGLNRISAIDVVEAENGSVLKGSTAYIAPGGKQMRLKRGANQDFEIELTEDPPVNRFKPSVDYLFHSISEMGVAGRTCALLLTGMGEDGARGLLSLKSHGAFTIAQDEASSVVFGMPKIAIDMNAASMVLSLGQIAQTLQRI